uniref:Rx N-terminal domain-containing protein n=1 Tax=Oryza brachyantha TaxID=4533 RepID=J3M5U9_ORYBR
MACVDKDLSELHDIHGEITSWLSTVRDGSIECDPQFRCLIKLKNVADDIDDLLHEVQLESEKHKMQRDGD